MHKLLNNENVDDVNKHGLLIHIFGPMFVKKAVSSEEPPQECSKCNIMIVMSTQR